MATVSANAVVDICILGAGPTRLAAAYYAGHRVLAVVAQGRGWGCLY